MSVEIGLVNPRLTILDRFAVAAGDVYRKSARRDMLPIIRGLMGQYGYTDAEPQVLETKVRGISPGYVAIGYQPDPSNPVRVVLDPAGHVRPTVGVATADGAPLKFLPGPANTTPENGAMEWTGNGVAPTFVFGATRKTFAFTEDAGGAGPFVALIAAFESYQVGEAAIERIRAQTYVSVGNDLLPPGTAQSTTMTSDGLTIAGVLPAGDTMALTLSALSFNGDRVVGPRLPHVADATGAGDIVAQFNALKAGLEAAAGHGLFASA